MYKSSDASDYNSDYSIISALKDKNFITNEQKELNILPVHHVKNVFQTITFGMGCFWGAESLFGASEGVTRTTVGYSGGKSTNPKYTKLEDHTEVLEIDYDPKIISYEDLLQLFWNNHEYGLSTKIKRQYMSIIFYHTEEQRELAEKSKLEEEIKRKPEIITTEIRPATIFYPAENYHQKYRLQEHKELLNSLGINSTDLLHKSYVATKLNGYLVGVGGMEQYLKEADLLGITPSQKEYVRYYVEKNQGRGLFC